MNNNPRIIVAHPHKQHSFQLATALENAGMLCAYVTTVYQKRKSLTSLLSLFLRGTEFKKAETRRCASIPDDKVIQFCEFWGLVYLGVMRITHNNKKYMDPLDAFVEKRFGKKLAKFIKRNNVDAVICYDTQSVTLFKELNNSCNTTRILDVSAANLLYLKKIYEHDMKVDSDFEERLKNERPTLFSKNSSKSEKRILEEIQNTDYFIVPSNFVKESLVFSGVSTNKIFNCPYGINLSNFKLKKTFHKKGNPIKFIYVGGIKQLKGIGHLLKAFNRIDKREASLTVVGAGNIMDNDVSEYVSNIDFKGMVLHEQMPQILSEHDVFVFPSLGDSFGFAPLEAAAVGLPLIISNNTGLADYITDGEEGYLIEPHSVEAITTKVEWFVKNPECIKEMGIKANKVAHTLTMEHYYECVTKIIKGVLKT